MKLGGVPLLATSPQCPSLGLLPSGRARIGLVPATEEVEVQKGPVGAKPVSCEQGRGRTLGQTRAVSGEVQEEPLAATSGHGAPEEGAMA